MGTMVHELRGCQHVVDTICAGRTNFKTAAVGGIPVIGEVYHFIGPKSDVHVKLVKVTPTAKKDTYDLVFLKL